MFENAKWITAGADFKESLPGFQKRFTARGNIQKATAYMTAYGVYDFFINGQKVGNQLPATTTAEISIPGQPVRTVTGGNHIFYSQA